MISFHKTRGNWMLTNSQTSVGFVTTTTTKKHA